MKRDYKVYLQDIFDCIERIEKYIGEMSYEDFLDDQKTVDAVIRNIEIIGEATKHVPDAIRKKYSLPWRQMAGMRDKVIHGYFDVIYSIVWETAVNDLPEVKPQIKEILEKE
ncbi:MAG: DUF86 domain-containing protein [Candidatus Methanofastidiosia archaeon]|jgi:uncharacterized protein with HEPN domain